MKELSVVAAVLIREGKILATQRGYGPQKDGWEFPGGKVEPGESPEEALKREIREELLADIEVGPALPVVTMDYPQFRIHLQAFLCRLSSRGVQLSEHEAARWLEREEVPSVDWLPADQRITEYLLAHWGEDPFWGGRP